DHHRIGRAQRCRHHRLPARRWDSHHRRPIERILPCGGATGRPSPARLCGGGAGHPAERQVAEGEHALCVQQPLAQCALPLRHGESARSGGAASLRPPAGRRSFPRPRFARCRRPLDHGAHGHVTVGHAVRCHSSQSVVSRRCGGGGHRMSARGLELTLAAIRAQLAAIAWPRYELRLMDAQRRQCLATRYWTATQLLDPDTVRFLRAHNREGCDVYFRPHAASQNAGYLLLDFDDGPCPLAAMRVAGHTPCLVVETSPGHQQAWVRGTSGRVTLALATAWQYGADPASAEWRHLGRLAGFTNRKPARLQPNGLPPWVRVVWRRNGALTE